MICVCTAEQVGKYRAAPYPSAVRVWCDNKRFAWSYCVRPGLLWGYVEPGVSDKVRMGSKCLIGHHFNFNPLRTGCQFSFNRSLHWTAIGHFFLRTNFLWIYKKSYKNLSVFIVFTSSQKTGTMLLLKHTSIVYFYFSSKIALQSRNDTDICSRNEEIQYNLYSFSNSSQTFSWENYVVFLLLFFVSLPM